MGTMTNSTGASQLMLTVNPSAASSRILSVSSSALMFRTPISRHRHLHLQQNKIIPARDRVIDMGKYRGKMLGSLPSSYLKWVSRNLRAGDTEEWAKLADQVLDDPVYKDRIEWEHAEKVLNGNAARPSSLGTSAVAELLQLSEMFGWDNQDKQGWSEIDFGLLGTSHGGRIPRISTPFKAKEVTTEKEEDGGGNGGRRKVRRTRVRRRRRQMQEEADMEGEDQVINGEHNSPLPLPGAIIIRPFPGRQALLNMSRPNWKISLSIHPHTEH